jgi:hypothetical protein
MSRMSSRAGSVSRKLAAAAILSVGISILAFVQMTDETGTAGNRDFICYWAAGQLLVHHQNPYDSAEVFKLEKSAGWREKQPMVTLSPPIVLFLALPLGFVSAKAGAVLWCLLIAASITIAIRLLWSLHGRPPNRLHLVAYCFAPTLACLLAGQTSGFVLLGLVLFLYLHRTRPLLAGLSLALCTLRPHLFIPFSVVWVAFVFTRRAYRLVAGAVLGLALLFAFTMFYPQSWPQYLARYKGQHVEAEFLPNFSCLLRLAIDRNAPWIQIVPFIVACLWALWYYTHHAQKWDWNTHGSLLMLVSVVVAPYSWFYDEIVPALLQAIYLTSNSRRSLVGFGALATIALAEVVSGVKPASGFYAWTATAWLLWYVYAVYLAAPSCKAQPDVITDQLGKGLEY